MANIVINQHSQLPPYAYPHNIEPSAAKGGDVVLCTVELDYNQSSDAGASWNSFYYAPKDLYPSLDKLCGDQSVLWMAPVQRFAMIGLDFFYGKPATSLEFAILDLSQAAAGNPVWMTFQIEGADFGLLNLAFDYPHLSVSTGYLYISSNVVATPDTTILRRDSSPVGWASGSVIIRVALADLWLIQSKQLGFQYIIHPGKSYMALAQNSVHVAHYATHKSTSELTLFSWSESKNNITSQTVHVPTWNDVDYASLTPDGKNWMAMLNGRMTGASTLQGDLVFAWTCGRDEKHPHPFIRLVMLKKDGEKWVCTSHRDIWHRNLAWGYASITGAGVWLGATPTPHIAMSCGWGGGERHFSNFSTGFVEMPITSASKFINYTFAKSTVGAERWGDFFTTHPHDRRADTFVTAGFVVQKSSSPGADPDDLESVVHYVEYAIS